MLAGVMRATTEATVDRMALDAILAPRDGFVAERALDAGRGDSDVTRFEAAEGPFRRYERTVALEPLEDGRVHVRQTVDFHLAAPLWSLLFVVPVRNHLRRIDEADGPQADPTDRPGALPWWSPPDRLDARASTSLATLASLSYVVGYLATLLTQTITYSAHEFGASRGAQGNALAAVRLDVILSLVLVGLADRRGRRRILLLSCSLGAVTTAVGALAPSLVGLAASQVIARGFVTAAVVVIGILAAEEMPTGSRAYAFSLLTMAGALGAGLSLFLLPIADLGDRGWRVLYAVAILGLPAAWAAGRHLTESRRFEVHHEPMAMAGSGHGRRFWLLAISGFLLALFTVPASQFLNEFLRAERHFSAARISIFTFATGTPGAIGIVVGGRLADQRGRRLIGAIAVFVGVGGTVAMFASHGWPLWAWSIGASVIGGAAVPALSVYGPELFPTAMRGRANGWISLVGRGGSVVGLIAAGHLSDRFGTLPPALAILALGPAVLCVLILVAYPETAHRTLEDLNPEDAAVRDGRQD
jgi:MFS family permease